MTEAEKPGGTDEIQYAPAPDRANRQLPVRRATPLAELDLPPETKIRLAAAQFIAFSDIVGARRDELATFGITDSDIAALEQALGCSFVAQPVTEDAPAGVAFNRAAFVTDSERRAGDDFMRTAGFNDIPEAEEVELGPVDRGMFTLLQRKDAALRTANENNQALMAAVDVLDASRKRWRALATYGLVIYAATLAAVAAAWWAS